MITTQSQLQNILDVIPVGSLVFVSYEAGRTPTAKADREAARYEDHARRHYVGTMIGAWVTRKGDLVFRLHVYNRDQEVGFSLVQGGYRTFNHNIGLLRSVDNLSG